MNLRLKLARLYIPLWIRKKKMKELFTLTSQAFGSREPRLKGLSQGEILRKYALFTKENTEKFLSEEKNIKIIQDLLYKKAFQIGCKFRKSLRISSPEEFMSAARLLYQLIGIDFQGKITGQITIRECYFSHIYSKDTCQLISSLDEGILSGLSGERGKLEFSDRLTSGAECCRAIFHFKDTTE